MKLKIFEDYIEFYTFLEAHNLLSSDDRLLNFQAKYSMINKGCSCGQAKRAKVCENAYAELVTNMPKEIVDKIKIAGQYGSIQMYNNGVLLYEG